MKENFEKAKVFVKEHNVEIALVAYGLTIGTVGYLLGKAAGGITYDQIDKILGTGARLGYDYVKDNGLEAAEKTFKMISK